MKIPQIAVGGSYEDKRAETIRSVTAIFGSERGKVVEYVEDPARPLYRHLQKPERMPLAEFAEWAARLASAKNPFKNWQSGPVERQFAKNR